MTGYGRIALMRFPQGLAAEDETALTRTVSSFAGSVEGLREAVFGRDTSGRGQGYTHAAAFLFESEEAHDRYVPHPDHVALGQFLRERGCEVLLMTFPVGAE